MRQLSTSKEFNLSDIVYIPTRKKSTIVVDDDVESAEADFSAALDSAILARIESLGGLSESILNYEVYVFLAHNPWNSNYEEYKPVARAFPYKRIRKVNQEKWKVLENKRNGVLNTLTKKTKKAEKSVILDYFADCLLAGRKRLKIGKSKLYSIYSLLAIWRFF